MKPWDKKYKLKGWYKKWRIEKDFQAEISKKMRDDWFITFHPQDIWYALKFLDLHFIHKDWDIWWIEFKKINLDSFNVKNFEDSQVILLPQLEKINKELCKVYIYSVKHNDYKIFNFSDLRNNRNSKWWIKIFNNKKNND